jgi:Ig-like domain-containing protein
MQKIPYAVVAVLCTGALLAGCNLPFLANNEDTASVQTAAALTVQAQIGPVGTATSTFTPVPFPTIPPVAATQPPANTLPPAATATSNCDNASFISDVTIPDNTVVPDGSDFTKTWRLKNIGACSWTPSYALVFISGASMDGPAVQALTGNVNPGQTVDLSVALTAPTANGTYTGNWGLRNGAGVIFSHFYVQIVVNSGGGGGSSSFAVTHVSFTFSTVNSGSNLNCPDVIAHITTNGAGDVQYHFTQSDGASAPVQTLHFDSAGTKDVDKSWLLPTSAGTANRWIGIYVDDPNHQDFGHQSFTSTCSAP